MNWFNPYNNSKSWLLSSIYRWENWGTEKWGSFVLIRDTVGSCYGWYKCLYPSIHMLKSWPPMVMDLGGGAFGRWVGNVSSVLMSGISEHSYERNHTEHSTPSIMWGCYRRSLCPERGPLRFHASRTVSNKAMWFLSYSVCDILG